MTERLHLGPRHRARLEALLREHLPDVEVWAYGSRVNGQSHDGSDLDLVLRGSGLEEIDICALGDFTQALHDSTIPFLVEARDWARLPERFHREIEREYVVLAGGDRSFCGDDRVRQGDCFARADCQASSSASSSAVASWQEVGLGDVVRLVSGGTPSKGKPTYWDGEVPWVSARDMKQFLLRDTGQHITAEGLANGTRQVPAGTLLLLTRGMRLLKELPVCVTERPMAFNQDIKALLPKGRIDPKFLPYLVVGNKRRLLNLVDLAGHGTGRINSDELRALDVRLPPPCEQRAIAHILGTLDDKIELNRRMNKTLEAMARALFNSWFVDFDPVRAKMEGRGTGLTEDIANLFPDRLIDSEMGEIPEGWGVVPLDTVAGFQNGLALQKFRPAPNEERLPAVKIAQLRAGEASSGEWASSSIKPACIIEDGDVLFSWSGSLLIKIWCGGRAALNQHLFKVTSEEYPKWFYLQSLLSHLAEFRRIAQDKATTMGHIKRHHLTEALCAAPPDGVIERLSGTFSSLLEGRVANELSSRTHVALRDALLPKLISGEIRIPDAERALEAST